MAGPSLIDDKGKEIKETGPASPVSISDFSDIPEAGDKFYVVSDIQKPEKLP